MAKIIDISEGIENKIIRAEMERVEPIIRQMTDFGAGNMDDLLTFFIAVKNVINALTCHPEKYEAYFSDPVKLAYLAEGQFGVLRCNQIQEERDFRLQTEKPLRGRKVTDRGRFSPDPEKRRISLK